MKEKKSELDKQIHTLNQQRGELYIKHDQHLISKEKFEKLINEMDTKHRELINIKLKEMQKAFKVHTKEVKENQEIIKEQVKKIRKKRNINKDVGQHIKDDSCSSLIIKALKLKTVNTESKAIAIIKQWKPDIHKENITKQIRNTISAIKQNKQPRYKNYTWDKKTYTVNQKCQQQLPF